METKNLQLILRYLVAAIVAVAGLALGLSDAERCEVLDLDAAFFVAQEEDARPVTYCEEEE